jgi:hypothetical protein
MRNTYLLLYCKERVVDPEVGCNLTAVKAVFRIRIFLDLSDPDQLLFERILILPSTS